MSFVVTSGSEYESGYSSSGSDSCDEDLIVLGKRKRRPTTRLYDQLMQEKGLVKSEEPARRVRPKPAPSPFYPSYFTDLTTEMEGVKECPILGRDLEVITLASFLTDDGLQIRPLLQGQSGVGKSSIVVKLAWLIAHNKCVEALKGKSVVQIDCESLVGTHLTPEDRNRLPQVFRRILHEQYERNSKSIFFLKNVEHISQDEHLWSYFNAIVKEKWSLIGSSGKKDQGAIKSVYFTPITIKELDKTTAVDLVSHKIATHLICGKKIEINRKDVKFSLNLARKYVHNIPSHLAAVRMIRQSASRKLVIEKGLKGKKLTVDRKLLAETVSNYVSRTADEILAMGREEISQLKNKLKRRIVGQDHIIDRMCEYIADFKDGLTDPTKPPGVFILLGPTGVGKTELAKSLAEEYYNDSSCFIRVDMSEYMEKESVSRLIGAAPGLVGYDSGSSLIQAVNQKPNSIILFDEGEKAHDDVWNLFLQIFDDGRLTDGKNTTGDFTNAFIFISTNLDEETLKQRLKPEVLNRIDEVMQFNSVDKKLCKETARVYLYSLQSRFKEKNRFNLHWTEDVLKLLAKTEFDESHGWRDYCRNIDKHVRSVLRSVLPAGESTPKEIFLEVKRRKLVARI